MKTRVVNIYYEQYDVYIGRSKDLIKGKWGNPYSNKENTLAKFKVDSVESAIKLYRDSKLLTDPELILSLESLRNKSLGCFCKNPKSNTDNPCHGDVLVEILENPNHLSDEEKLNIIELLKNYKNWNGQLPYFLK